MSPDADVSGGGIAGGGRSWAAAAVEISADPTSASQRGEREPACMPLHVASPAEESLVAAAQRKALACLTHWLHCGGDAASALPNRRTPHEVPPSRTCSARPLDDR